MPWCDTCDRLVADDELDGDACPACHTSLAEPERKAVSWRFRLLIVASIGYLTWRTVQGVQWLTHHA